MLNLQELEQKLDAALELETSESLSRWLLSKRSALPAFFGEGNFEERQHIVYAYDFPSAGSGKFSGKVEVPEGICLHLAA